jgi:glycosyltransferase involved in cell wall biosynthesis
VTCAPEVTVVVPVWDRYCVFLNDCVESILEQGTAMRVVVVDNASAEPVPTLPGSVDVIRASRRVTAGAARNLALAEIDTSSVLFCDADDRLLPGAISFLRARLAARPELVGCVSRYVSWNPETGTRVVLDRSPRPIVFRVARHPQAFALANLRYNCFPIVGALLRTDAVRDAGGFGDSSVGEDWILGTQLAFRGPLEFHQRPAFLRRVHAGSLWHRSHTRATYHARCELLRDRLERDPAVPRAVKACLPLLALVHRYDASRAARCGTVEPEIPLLQPTQVVE